MAGPPPVGYYFFRNGIAAERGYMLDDSGPIFPGSTHSRPLHDTIRAMWGLEAIIESEVPELASQLADLGALNRLLADEFPEDRLATTFFRLDYNFSLYSYRRFHDDPPREEIYRMWWEDTQLLMAEYDRRDNLGYFIPFWREFNDSHCALIFDWAGTEIEEAGMNARDYVEHLLDDDAALRSHVETAREGPYADIAP